MWMSILDIEKGAIHSKRLRSPDSLMKEIARRLACSAAQQPTPRGGVLSGLVLSGLVGLVKKGCE